MALFDKLPGKVTHLFKGEQAERLAHQYLIQRGLKLLCRNYRCKFGELDLIMKDGSTLVFVEVRYRKSDAFGTAAETITITKQSRIITTAQTYMAANRIDCQIRFDVVAISGKGNINWIKNAF